VLLGLAASPSARESPRTRRTVGWVIASGGVLATLHAAAVVPWGMAYYNPLLGGGSAAVKQVPVGWNEAQEIASRRIRDLEHGRCRGVTLSGLNPFLATTHECGRFVLYSGRGKYYALYVSDRQLMTPVQRANLRKRRKLVSVVRVRGIDYVELWRRRGG
jgi:hypothetical protein